MDSGPLMDDLVCKKTLIVGGKVISRELHGGYWLILARNPCLWTGGIHPARVSILYNGIPSSTLSLPIHICGPFGAYSNCDEMTIYSLYSRESVREFESFKWDYESIESKHLEHSSVVVYVTNEEKVSNIVMWTTLTYSDSVRNTIVTQCHVLHMNAVRKSIHFNAGKENL